MEECTSAVASAYPSPHPRGGLSTLESGEMFEYIDENECEFMHEEIFCRHVYTQHGLSISNGDVIFDIGSNIGLFSLYCPTVNSNLKILACEPIPPIFDVLSRNVFHFRSYFPDCTFILEQIGLIDSIVDTSTLEFSYYPNFPGESTRHLKERRDQRSKLEYCVGNATAEGIAGLEIDEEGLSLTSAISPPTSDSVGAQFLCRVDTVELVAQKYNLDKIDFLKIDVEGDELLVLHGVGMLWPRVKQVVVEVHDVDNRLAMVLNFLESKGFQVCADLQRIEVSENGFLSFVPEELKLYYVYASRSTSFSK